MPMAPRVVAASVILDAVDMFAIFELPNSKIGLRCVLRTEIHGNKGGSRDPHVE